MVEEEEDNDSTGMDLVVASISQGAARGKGWVAHQAQLGGVGCAGSPAVASCGQQSEACLVHHSFVRRRKREESWPHQEVVQG
jgi:hypothetical protein